MLLIQNLVDWAAADESLAQSIRRAFHLVSSKDEQAEVESTNYLIALAALFIGLLSVLPRRLAA